MKYLLILCLLFSGCAHFNVCTPKNGNYIKDSKGRICIYHGVNVSNFSKTNDMGSYLPWQKDEDYARLNDWGFNLVRYLVFWHALEPVEGMVSYTYIDNTIGQIKKLQKLGIDVVIDLHQDLYGPVEGFCGGNGFPYWTANTGGLLFKCQTPWSANYLQPALISCYKNFWSSYELQQKYIEYVKTMYSALDTMSNVIGFDIMNEPFPSLPPNTGNLTNWKDIHNIGLAKEVAEDVIRFETKTLPDFYNKIRDAIVEYKKPIWFEPAIWTSSGIPSILNFNPGSGSVFFPHYYDVKIHEGKPYTKTVSKIMNLEVKETVLNAKRFGTPVLFGEFGAPASSIGYLDYLGDFLALLDQYNIGWTYFTYDKGHPFGVLDEAGKETAHMTKLVRVYPQKIAGVNPRYNIEGNVFTLSYEHTINAETVIFIPLSLPNVRVVANGEIMPYITGPFIWNKQGETVIQISWRND